MLGTGRSKYRYGSYTTALWYCRQRLREQTDRQAQALKVLMIAPSGKCMLVADAYDLLPFGFSADFL